MITKILSYFNISGVFLKMNVGKHPVELTWPHPPISVAPEEWLDGNIQSCIRFCLFTLLCFLMCLCLILVSPFLWRSLDFRRKVVNLHTVSVTSCLGAESAKGTMLTQHKAQQLLFLATFKMPGCALPHGRSWSTSSQPSGFLSRFVGCDAICSDKHKHGGKADFSMFYSFSASLNRLSISAPHQSLLFAENRTRFFSLL